MVGEMEREVLEGMEGGIERDGCREGGMEQGREGGMEQGRRKECRKGWKKGGMGIDGLREGGWMEGEERGRDGENYIYEKEIESGQSEFLEKLFEEGQCSHPLFFSA